jgi:hypothetical protein
LEEVRGFLPQSRLSVFVRAFVLWAAASAYLFWSLQQATVNQADLDALGKSREAILTEIAVLWSHFLANFMFVGILFARTAGVRSLFVHRLVDAMRRFAVLPLYAVVGGVIGAMIAYVDHQALLAVPSLRSMPFDPRFDPSAFKSALTYFKAAGPAGAVIEACIFWAGIAVCAFMCRHLQSVPIECARVYGAFVAIPMMAALALLRLAIAPLDELIAAPATLYARTAVVTLALGAIFAVGAVRNSVEAGAAALVAACIVGSRVYGLI